MIQKSWFKPSIIVVAAAVFLVGECWATTILLSDWDNTLAETREEYNGTFQTPIILYRIDRRQTVLQDPIEKYPREIVVNQADLERVRPYLAQEQTAAGTLGRKITLHDGRIVEPGIYYLDPVNSFKYFASAASMNEKGNHFLATFEKSLKRYPRGNWKGPAWPLWSMRLSHPETAKTTGILTIRNQKEEMLSVFGKAASGDKTLNGLGLKIGEVPNADLVINLGAPEWNKYTIDFNPRDAHMGKVEFLRDFVTMTLKHLELTEKDLILDADGKESRHLHYLIFAEDNQQILESVARMFQELARSANFPVKFAIVNAGTTTQVRESGRPVFSVVTSDGRFRAPKAGEVLGAPFTAKQEKKCLDALNKIGGRGPR